VAKELTKAEEFFLKKFNLNTVQLEQTIGKALGKQIDYADLYFEYRTNESVSLEEGMVKKAAKSVGQGVGVRAVAEDGKVLFLPISIVEDDQTSMWVDRIPDGTRVIVQGQDFVREGQRVEFTPEDSQKGPRAGDVRLIEG